MSGSIKKNLRCPTLFFFIIKSFSCGDVVPVDHRGTSPCHHSPNPASGVEEGQFKAGTTFGVQVSNVRLLQESKKKVSGKVRDRGREGLHNALWVIAASIRAGPSQGPLHLCALYTIAPMPSIISLDKCQLISLNRHFFLLQLLN